MDATVDPTAGTLRKDKDPKTGFNRDIPNRPVGPSTTQVCHIIWPNDWAFLNDKNNFSILLEGSNLDVSS